MTDGLNNRGQNKASCYDHRRRQEHTDHGSLRECLVRLNNSQRLLQLVLAVQKELCCHFPVRYYPTASKLLHSSRGQTQMSRLPKAGKRLRYL